MAVSSFLGAAIFGFVLTFLDQVPNGFEVSSSRRSLIGNHEGPEVEVATSRSFPKLEDAERTVERSQTGGGVELNGPRSSGSASPTTSGDLTRIGTPVGPDEDAAEEAKKALMDRSELSIRAQVQATERLRHNSRQFRTGDEWAQHRKADVRAWLVTWRNLDSQIDRAWRPEVLPILNPSPPKSAIRIVSGTRPEDVDDMAIRRLYEAELDRNAEYTRDFRRQLECRRLKERFEPTMRRFVVEAYSQDPARPDEIASLVEEYVADEDLRRGILDELGSMPQSGRGEASSGPPLD